MLANKRQKTLLQNPRGNGSFIAAASGFIVTRSLVTTVDDIAEQCWKYPKSVEYAKEAYESGYIQGMQNGNLNPNFYGQYVVEDAVYIMLCVKTFNYLAAKYKDKFKTLYNFFTQKAQIYETYGKQMTDDWH